MYIDLAMIALFSHLELGKYCVLDWYKYIMRIKYKGNFMFVLYTTQMLYLNVAGSHIRNYRSVPQICPPHLQP